jgi:hypothetical protein
MRASFAVLALAACGNDGGGSDGRMIRVSTTGGGTVSTENSLFDRFECGVQCLGDFVFGEPVTFTATPDPGSTFVGWSGLCIGTESRCTVTGDGYVAATFGPLYPAEAHDLAAVNAEVAVAHVGDALAVLEPHRLRRMAADGTMEQISSLGLGGHPHFVQDQGTGDTAIIGTLDDDFVFDGIDFADPTRPRLVLQLAPDLHLIDSFEIPHTAVASLGPLGTAIAGYYSSEVRLEGFEGLDPGDSDVGLFVALRDGAAWTAAMFDGAVVPTAMAQDAATNLWVALYVPESTSLGAQALAPGSYVAVFAPADPAVMAAKGPPMDLVHVRRVRGPSTFYPIENDMLVASGEMAGVDVVRIDGGFGDAWRQVFDVVESSWGCGNTFMAPSIALEEDAVWIAGGVCAGSLLAPSGPPLSTTGGYALAMDLGTGTRRHALRLGSIAQVIPGAERQILAWPSEFNNTYYDLGPAATQSPGPFVLSIATAP